MTGGNEKGRAKNAATLEEIMRMAAEEALRLVGEAKPLEGARPLGEAGPLEGARPLGAARPLEGTRPLDAAGPAGEAKPLEGARPLGEAMPPDEALRALLPVAARCLERLMDDEKTPATARIKCVEIVLDRVFGKAGADAPGPLVLSGANELAD